MTTGERIAVAAVPWIGTPFRWGNPVRGLGCDCKGLVAGVARDCGRPEADSVEALCIDYGAGQFDPRRLRAGLMRLFDRVTGENALGDILLLVVKDRAQHLALVSAVENGRPRRMIHVYPGGPARVIEATIGSGHRIDSVWRWRETLPSSAEGSG